MIHHTIIPCDLWNKRLGHLHFRALPSLKRMVKGLPIFYFVHDVVCRGFSLANHDKNKFPRIHTIYKGILYLLHSDVCGPMSSPSLNGRLYYVLFIDDFSCKDQIYFMKSKSETFSKLQEYKSLVENHTSRNIRSLRYDSGGEFKSNSFNEFCSDAGICIQLTNSLKPTT